MDTVEEEWEKFPTDCNANTPRQHAAEKGHLETCRMINEYIPENKNIKNEPNKRFWQHDVFIRQGEEDLIHTRDKIPTECTLCGRFQHRQMELRKRYFINTKVIEVYQ